MKPTPGEAILTDDDEMVIRGHLTTAEAAEAVTDEHGDERVAVGAASHTWARRGFFVNEDGEVCNRGVYCGNRYKGQRGAFAVTIVDTRRVE